MNIAIILAAGKGKRFGQLKQFALLQGKPVIVYSMQKFNHSKFIDKIIVITIKYKISYITQLIKQYHFQKITNIIVGGKERQDSVNNALTVLPDKGYVAIHDSARPLFSTKLIKIGFDCVKKYKACVPVIQIQDTIKQVISSKVVKTIDRSSLYYIQTPQFFNIKLLKQAYAKAYQNNYFATDDATLIEKLGIKVHTFAGDKQNIKITEKQDLDLVKNWL